MNPTILIIRIQSVLGNSPQPSSTPVPNLAQKDSTGTVPRLDDIHTAHGYDQREIQQSRGEYHAIKYDSLSHAGTRDPGDRDDGM
jgi:hypothetical protein